MIEERNQTLTKDNAKLLQRWLDAKQTEANRVNEANEFYEDMQSRRQAMNRKTGSSSNSGGNAEENADGRSASHGSESGNGEEKRASGPQMRKDGTPSPGQKAVNLTPNG